MTKRLSKMLCPLAIFLLHGAEGQGAGNKVDDAITHLIKRLRTPALKEGAADQQKVLRGKDSIARRKAVLFFADLRAKEVLLACLRSGDPGFQDTAAECLAVFGPGDLADLYRTAEALIPELLQTGSDNLTARYAIVDKLATRTSSILGIKDMPIKDFTNKGIRAWWAKAAKTTMLKSPLSELEAAINPPRK